MKREEDWLAKEALKAYKDIKELPTWLREALEESIKAIRDIKKGK